MIAVSSIATPESIEDLPLSHLLERHIRQQPAKRQVAAELERTRIDLWLHRRTIASDINVSRRSTDFVDLAGRYLEGIKSKDKLVRTSAYAISGRIDFKLCEDMVVVGVGRVRRVLSSKRLRELRSILIKDIPADFLAVGQLELALLRLLATNAAICIGDVLNVPVSVKMLEDEYRTLLTFLSEINRSWKPGQILTFEESLKQERRTSGSGCVPWPVAEYSLAVALALDNYSARTRKIKDVSDVSGEQAEKILKLTSYLKQSAWLMVRQVRTNEERLRKRGTGSGVNLKLGELYQHEQKILGTLAFCEQDILNHSRAGLYSVFSLQLSGNDGGRLTDDQAYRLRCIADNLGLGYTARRGKTAGDTTNDSVTFPRRLGVILAGLLKRIPIHLRLVRPLAGNSKFYPRNLREVFLISNDQIAPIIKRLYECGFAFSAPIAKSVSKVADNPSQFPETERRHLVFELAVRLGMLRDAARIASPNREFPFSLTKEHVKLFSRALASVYQKALPCVNHGAHERLRTQLRRMWKQCTLNTDETLFLHEVKRGLFHATAESIASGDAVVWGAYASLTEDQRKSLYDHFAERVANGLIDPLNQHNFKLGNLSIPRETIFVSIAIRDGHELSVLMTCGGSHIEQFIFKTSTVENGKPAKWSVISKRLSDTHGLWAPIKHYGELGWVPWGSDLTELGKEILSKALELNPQANCIALACDSIMRGLPWQHLFSVVLRGYLRKLRRRQRRNGGPSPYEGIVVLHVPGAHTFLSTREEQRNGIHYKAGRETEPDEDDPVYKSIKKVVETNRDQWKAPRYGATLPSVLSVFAQGERDSIESRIVFDGSALDEDECKKLAGYVVTIVNSCHAGYVEENPIGDLGGLPGFFISHGSKLVVAPIAHIAPETAAALDSHITAWLCDQRKSFRTAYLAAVAERPDIAFYSLYGVPWEIDEANRQVSQAQGSYSFATTPAIRSSLTWV